MEKEKLKGPKKDRMSKIDRLDKLQEDINNITSQANSK